MDISDTIEILQRISVIDKIYDIPHSGEALGVAIEALEKQIPKKPIVTSKGEEEYSGCPVCNKFVFDDYCQCCGQAIDWE